MLTYNTQQPGLVLPEYGRTIQNMVNHCKTIEDRDKRNECAQTIIAAMANLFPQVKNSVEDRMKLWDHLAIMSGFELDIDYPVEIVNAEQLSSRPQPLRYANEPMHYRHYGRNIELMLEKACEMEEGAERDELVQTIANHMKKSLIIDMNDYVDDRRIFQDILQISRGLIRLDAERVKLCEFKEIAVSPKKKKKK